jgi:hypothetical protein
VESPTTANLDLVRKGWRARREGGRQWMKLPISNVWRLAINNTMWSMEKIKRGQSIASISTDSERRSYALFFAG